MKSSYGVNTFLKLKNIFFIFNLGVIPARKYSQFFRQIHLFMASFQKHCFQNDINAHTFCF